MPAEEVPAILKAAWSVCTPRDQPLVDQIVPIEREFLVKYAKYVTEVYTSKEKTFDLKQKENAIKDVVSTAQSRIAVLVKEVNPSLTHAVMAIVLYLLSNILTNDHVKYKTQDDMLAVYTTFNERPEAEKKNLFLTANWMNILFRVLPARKNKGIAMDIIPKFVEGNTAHYVTGGGQTQATRDRVFIYETEGDCKPIKRVKRKSRTKLQEEADAEAEEAAKLLMNKRRAESSEEKSSRKKISINGTSKDTITSSIGSQPFHSLPAAFYQAVPLPIPVISPRSQSSFSQAATVIANFGEVQTELSSNTTNNASGGQNDISYIISPRERYININDPRAIPNILKPEKVASAHPYSTTTPLFLTEGGKGNVTKPSSSVSFAPPVALTTGVSRSASTSSNFDILVDTIGSLNDNELDEAGDQQLALLREASADSDI